MKTIMRCLVMMLFVGTITIEMMARWVQTNGPCDGDGYVYSFTVSGANLFAQTIPQENVQSRIDAKRIHSHQQMIEQTKGHLHQSEIKSLYQRPSPQDSLMQFPMAQSKKQKVNSFNRTTLPQSNMYVADTVIVFSTTDTSRYIYVYDSKGNMTEEIHQLWDNIQWVNFWRDTYTYDAKGNQLTFLWEVWSDNQWVSGERNTYTYDGNGNQLTWLYEKWYNNQWVNYRRYTSTYDANGNQLTWLYEQWSNNQWVNFERNTYTYDANGNRLTHLYEQWYNNQWVNFERNIFTYDANGNRLTHLYEYWSNNQWVNSSRSTYTYDANGNPLTYLYESWSNNQWVNQLRYTYTYDANGNQLTELSESWSNNQWVNDYRYTYKYVYNKLLSEGMSEYWDGDSWESRDVSYKYSEIFRGGYKILFTYKLIVTNVNKNDGVIIKEYSLSQNYPNPFNPTTTIRYALPSSAHVKLTVHDILGREIVTLVNEEQSAGWKEVEWQGAAVSSGMYFYQLKAKDKREIKKMILMK